MNKTKSCSSIYTPVQRGSTCWFAALMMCMFFSQYMRVVSSVHVKRLLKKDNWKTPIAEAMLKILQNYEINSLNKNIIGKIEPRAFLRALRRYDPMYFDSRPGDETDTGASYGPYYHKMLSFMEVPHLSVTVPRGHTDAKYSAYNFDLPLDEKRWKNAVETLDPKGSFVDTEYPEVIILHREAGESHLQNMWKTYRPNMYTVYDLSNKNHVETITYNKNKYVIDSCILPSFISTNTCSMSHVIAGITCNNERYIYNGWAARSGDKAMKSVTREMPCALMPADWMKEKAMCINNNNECTMNIGKKKNEFCFESFKRSSVTYVRSDIAEKAGYTSKNISISKQSVQKMVESVSKNTNKNKRRKLEELKKKIQMRK
ncbi:hypothetical protein NY2A_B298L [Paramecium bursaria Chlorella virus NY2A]|uniref:Uncharacterized protein B298L n=1 Tax=Paramecium bursaria Chlorella virus NY2A TaxID=46021 RepID=A7IWH3_PBCVN|nr:hypothetical protein NY2A_B298L [Paramecium bursaria Chlorella virus NY2A]ABT14697.1 hypothetical protein NY2A_B298L [Paramecium bursaria Chlorella virus NY2A]